MLKKIKRPVGIPQNKTSVEAERLGVSIEVLLSLYHRGVVPAVRISERILLFNPDATDRALRVQHEKVYAPKEMLQDA